LHGLQISSDITGWVYDITRDYSNSFFLGGAFIMSSCLLMCWPWLRRIRSEKKMERALSADLKPYIFGSSILMSGDMPVENGDVV
jgi:hypothetical protein